MRLNPLLVPTNMAPSRDSDKVSTTLSASPSAVVTSRTRSPLTSSSPFDVPIHTSPELAQRIVRMAPARAAADTTFASSPRDGQMSS